MKKYKLGTTIKLLLMLIICVQFIYIYKIYNLKLTTVYKTTYNFNVEKDTLYDYVIEDLRKSEGLKLKIYKCPANHLSIGYGHIIKPHESFINFDTSDAEFILKYDFEQCMQLVPQHLTLNKKLAIAHFIYSIGGTKYNKSSVKVEVDKGLPIISIIKYTKYKHEGKYKTSPNLLKGRMFEYYLYTL